MTMSRTVHASHHVPASGRRCRTAAANGANSGNKAVSTRSVDGVITQLFRANGSTAVELCRRAPLP
jgi:hypothetical protein